MANKIIAYIYIYVCEGELRMAFALKLKSYASSKDEPIFMFYSDDGYIFI